MEDRILVTKPARYRVDATLKTVDAEAAIYSNIELPCATLRKARTLATLLVESGKVITADIFDTKDAWYLEGYK